ncbi:MAG: oxidoreductase, partial [Alphaproteobacteria bacterium]|nr:oxidoreductase [Alphaproteobacteria bacterium]
TEEGAALMVEAIDEVAAIAAAAGFAPRPQSRDRVQTMLTERGGVNSASMRQDLEAGRRTEADAILGDLLRRARRLGVSTPLLRAAWCHLQVHENRLAANS